jgi:hypothetical protein
MSPRAAWRLEALGFERVYDFAGGRTEWIERGLPTTGDGPFLVLVGQVVRPATTCRPETRAGVLRRDLTPGPDSICAVLNDQGIVMGRIRWDDLPDDDEDPAETFMRLGPATVRPSEELAPLLERMREAKVTTILVATAEGRYVGAVNRDDGEAFIRERQAGPRKPHAVL